MRGIDDRPVCPEGAALDNCLLVEPSARRAGEVDKGALRPCRLPEYCHPGRVAPECTDVALDPGKSSLLVEDPVVARSVVRGLGVELGMGKEPESAEPVVRRNDDDAFLCKSGPVIHRHGEGHFFESPAIEEDHDRQFFVGNPGRGPDIEVQAVLAHVQRSRRSWLGTGCSILFCFLYAVPGQYRCGRSPPQIAGRRSCKRDAEVNPDPILVCA